MTLFSFHLPLFHHSTAQVATACMFRAMFYTVGISSFSTFYGPACYRHAVSHAFLAFSSGSLMMLSWILAINQKIHLLFCWWHHAVQRGYKVGVVLSCWKFLPPIFFIVFLIGVIQPKIIRCSWNKNTNVCKPEVSYLTKC